jgi:hypothetical protein
MAKWNAEPIAWTQKEKKKKSRNFEVGVFSN